MRWARAVLVVSLASSIVLTGACFFSIPNAVPAPSDAADAPADTAKAETATPEAGVPDAEWQGCDASTDAYFCDDFDRFPLDAQWYEPETMSGSGGEVRIDSDASVSPPSSLLVVVAAVPQPRASISHGLPNRAKRIRCGWDLRIDHRDQSEATIFLLDVDPSNKDQVTCHFYDLRIRPDDTVLYDRRCLADGGNDNTLTSFASLPVGEWMRFHFELSLVDGTATIDIDGGRVVTYQKQAVPPYASTLYLGGHSSDAKSEAWRMRYDNVWCDVESNAQ